MSSVKILHYEVVTDEHTDKKIACYFNVDLNNKLIKCKASGWAEFTNDMEFIEFRPDKDFFIADSNTNNLSKSDKIKIVRIISSAPNKKIIVSLINKKLRSADWQTIITECSYLDNELKTFDQDFNLAPKSVTESDVAVITELPLKEYVITEQNNNLYFKGTFFINYKGIDHGYTIKCTLTENESYYKISCIDSVNFYHESDTDNHIKSKLSFAKSRSLLESYKKKSTGFIEELVNKEHVKLTLGNISG